VGGQGVFLAFFIVSISSLFISGTMSPKAIGILLSSGLIFIFGLVDDLREVSVAAKFLFQLFTALILVIFGVRCQIVGIAQAVNLAISLVWIVGMSNAFNHLDITDGLAGGAAAFSSLGFLIISLLNQDRVSAIFSLALLGALIGFIFFNLPPAKVYMGNRGSHFLGLVLAAISLNISYASLERRAALLSPILILGFPLYDTAFLVLMRLKKCKLPFLKSNDHLVLRFLSSGCSKPTALLFMLGISALFVVSGILVSQLSNSGAMAVIAAVFFICGLLAWQMAKVRIDD
jgi:UDP-GlcNAc:undecaprenyl-phosphate GlcNAc-1-phosphate transferase